MAEKTMASPFMKLPCEIRLIIYNLLLVYETNAIRTPIADPMVVSAGYHIYEKTSEDTDPSKHVLSIRTESPTLYSSRNAQNLSRRSRTPYHVRSDRFRARCMESTYTVINNPGIHAGILSVNRQIHSEAASVLYSSYTFDFDTAIEAVVPFLSDLTLQSRSHIKRLSIVKRALPYDKEFDRCEWANVCRFLTTNMSLAQLSLGIVAGKPFSGWDGLALFTKSDFARMSMYEGMEWTRQLMAIKGLKSLDIKAFVEHCPQPMSNSMAFFVNFSASIETGFADFMRSEMIATAGCEMAATA